jgi:hypothetical protein
MMISGSLPGSLPPGGSLPPHLTWDDSEALREPQRKPPRKPPRIAPRTALEQVTASSFGMEKIVIGDSAPEPVQQWTATQHRDDLRLIPPLAEEFALLGTDLAERARRWALEWRYLLAADVPACAHGLYLMPSCPGPGTCRSDFGQLDHARIWVPDPGEGGGRPFLLAHPYAKEVTEATRIYARAHGLVLGNGNRGPEDYPGDDWYGHGTLPIRMTIPPNWPLWPIEAAAVILLHTQPVAWPDADHD